MLAKAEKIIRLHNMDYSSLFNEFLCADFGTKTKKHDFFDAILGYIASNSSHFFQIMGNIFSKRGLNHRGSYGLRN